jgi:tRNA A22 N-methylase
VLERFHVGGFMISNEISMKSLDSFFEEDREIYEILAAEHIKKINQYKKLEKTIGPK